MTEFPERFGVHWRVQQAKLRMDEALRNLEASERAFIAAIEERDRIEAIHGELTTQGATNEQLTEQTNE